MGISTSDGDYHEDPLDFYSAPVTDDLATLEGAEKPPSSRGIDLKGIIEDGLEDQRYRDNVYDILKTSDDPRAKEAIKNWGSVPLWSEDGYQGYTSNGMIAMEPFDPSSLAPLGVPHKIGGEGGGGGVETIKSPAVRHTESGKVFEEMNHGLATMKAEDSLGQSLNYNHLEDGFTTSHGRFVDRMTARDIAASAEEKGIEQFGAGRGKRNRGLISEDLKFVQDWIVKKYAPVWDKIKDNMNIKYKLADEYPAILGQPIPTGELSSSPSKNIEDRRKNPTVKDNRDYKVPRDRNSELGKQLGRDDIPHKAGNRYE